MTSIPDRHPVFMVNDFETLRVLSDPLRLQILEALDNEPQTANQVAKKLGLPVSRLYYHLNQLESIDLIEVVETRIVNNMIEKLYWLTAEEIDIDKNLFDFSSAEGHENLSNFILTSFESTRTKIMRSIQALKTKREKGVDSVPHDMVIVNVTKRIKEETYQSFVERLKALIKEFGELNEESVDEKGGNYFSLNCYAFPSYFYKEDQLEEEN